MKNLANTTILYAEDELSVQLQYGNYFRNIFKEVYIASDGAEALALYKQKSPDAVILDINMPQINGIELTKKLKELKADLPIILLTARSDKDTLKKAIELQLLTYLEKPVSRDNLKAALTKLSEKLDNNNLLCLWSNKEEVFYTWHKQKKLLSFGDKLIKLTKKETLLFEFFIQKKSVCSYQDIYEYVWADSDKSYNESTIKTLLSSLKSKLPKDVIKNQYGIGYSLVI